MPTELAKAYVQIIPSADGISGGIEKVVSGELNTTGEKVGRSFAGRFLDVAAGAVTAGVGVVSGAAGAVWAAASKVAEAGDVIDKQSQKVGVSAEQYQAMAFAAEHCGFSVDTFTLAARNLDGTNFSGTVWDATEAIMALEDPADRAAMAAELFGERTAQQMAAMLNSNDTMTDYMNNLEGLGGLMSGEAVAASAAFEDSLADLQHSFDGVKTNLTAEFLPSMSEVMQGLTDMISGKDGGLEKVKEGINGFLKNLENLIPKLIDIAGQLISAFIQVFIDNLPQIVEMGVKLIIQLITGIIKEIPHLIAETPKIVSAFVNAIVDSMPSVVDVGQQIVDGVWRGIENARAAFTAKVRSFFSNIVREVKAALGIESPSKVFAKEVGQWIPAGVAQGITQNGDVVQNAMEEVMTGAKLASEIDISANTSALQPNGAIIAGLVNGLNAVNNTAPINLKVELTLDNTRAIAEAVFDDLLNVSKQRGVSLGTA